ncbi:MAG: hypothetical protein ACRDYV_16505, partial [Acidimicrobiia bacterium]
MLVAPALSGLVFGASPALAQAACFFTMPPELTIEVPPNTDSVLVRSGDNFLVDGVPCPPEATVHNVDVITVTSTLVDESEGFTIDLSGGPFAPGPNPASAPGDIPEIKIDVELGFSFDGSDLLRIVGSAGPDIIIAGSEGINLNGDD